MKNIRFAGLYLFIFILFTSGTTVKKIYNPYKGLELQLDSLRLKYNIPAIAYGVIRNDSILVENAIGYRNIETKEKVSLEDLFHIGSNTKSFTSFLSFKKINFILRSCSARVSPNNLQVSVAQYFFNSVW